MTATGSYSTYYQTTPDRILGCSIIYLHEKELPFSLQGVDSYWNSVLNRGLRLSRDSNTEQGSAVYSTTVDCVFDTIFYISNTGDILGYTSFSSKQSTHGVNIFRIKINLDISETSVGADLVLQFNLVGSKLKDSRDYTYSSSIKKPYGYSRFTTNLYEQSIDPSVAITTDAAIVTSEGLFREEFDSGINISDYKHTFNEFWVSEFEGDICVFMYSTETGYLKIISSTKHNMFGLPKIITEYTLDDTPPTSDYHQSKYFVTPDSIYVLSSIESERKRYPRQGLFISGDQIVSTRPNSLDYPCATEELVFSHTSGEWGVYESSQSDHSRYHINLYGAIKYDPSRTVCHEFSERALLLKDITTGEWFMAFTDNGVTVDFTNPSSYLKANYLVQLPITLEGSQLIDGMRHRPLQTVTWVDPVFTWKGHVFYLQENIINLL